MNGRDHTTYAEDIGAYLLGALTELERQAFERHMANCGACRDEVERLRLAADALPRSVEQVNPPVGLKTALMEVVEGESQEIAEPEPVRARAPVARRSLGERLFGGLRGGMRPVLAVAALALGVAAGFGVAQLGGGDESSRTFVATVDQNRVPEASGRLQVAGDGENGAILRVQGLPELENLQVYQAWVERDGAIIPQPTFEVQDDGGAAAAIPDSVKGADAVLVSREPRGGGSRAPSEEPILSVPL